MKIDDVVTPTVTTKGAENIRWIRTNWFKLQVTCLKWCVPCVWHGRTPIFCLN